MCRGPASLAVGDVTGDGFPDIDQGVPDYGLITAGGLFVWEGTARGPRLRPVAITQQTRGVAGNDEPGSSWSGRPATAARSSRCLAPAAGSRVRARRRCGSGPIGAAP